MALTQVSTGGVKNDAVTSGKIPANAVGTSEIADDAVTGAQIAANAVDSAEITAGAVDIAHLSASGVGDAKFLRGDNTWQTVSTSDATKMPLAGGTFTGDVVFDSQTNADRDITWDDSESILWFKDTTSAGFGTGSGSNPDAEISHSGGSLQIDNNKGHIAFSAETNYGHSFQSDTVVLAEILGSTHNIKFYKPIEITGPDASTGGSIRLYESNSNLDNYVKVEANGTMGANYTLTLPADGGSANQYLKTDGSGGTTWATVSTAEQDSSTGDYTLTSGDLKFATDVKGIRFNGNSSTGYIVADTTSSNAIQCNVGGNLNSWSWRFGGTEKFTFNSTGNIAFASGNGIDFSATADGTGSSQAEIFKDYEEGAWTPTISSGGSAVSGSNARYVRVGGLVYLSFNLESITNAASGTLQLQGMPFTPANLGKGPVAAHSIDSGHSGYLVVECTTGGNIHFKECDTNNANWANISGTEVEPGYLAFTLSYYTTV